jgi:hypothetical protein
MAIYKPSLLDKFKDFVNGLKSNWDEYEDHVAEFESHQADFESHTAETSAKHINESGNNANGSYTKFDDGTLICWNHFLMTTTSLSVTWTFPEPFNPAWNNRRLSNRNIAGSIKISDAFDGSGEGLVATPNITGQNFMSNSNTNATIKVRINSLDPGRQVDVMVMAIGRWK